MTLQKISFLPYLKRCWDIGGPYLIDVPKATLKNRAHEIGKWTPDFKVAVLAGSKEGWQVVIQAYLVPQAFKV